MPEEPDCKPVESSEFAAFMARKDLLHYIAFFERPNVKECCQTLEHRYYPPGTPANDKYNIHLYKWENLLWIFVSIPITDKRYMDEVAAENNLKLVSGVPNLISSEGVKTFPFGPAKNIFIIENRGLLL